MSIEAQRKAQKQNQGSISKNDSKKLCENARSNVKAYVYISMWSEEFHKKLVNNFNVNTHFIIIVNFYHCYLMILK